MDPYAYDAGDRTHAVYAVECSNGYATIYLTTSHPAGVYIKWFLVN